MQSLVTIVGTMAGCDVVYSKCRGDKTHSYIRHTRAHTRTHTHARTRTHTHAPTRHTQTRRAHTRTHTHTHETRPHTLPHAHARTRTHKHTSTQKIRIRTPSARTHAAYTHADVTPQSHTFTHARFRTTVPTSSAFIDLAVLGRVGSNARPDPPSNTTSSTQHT